MMQRQLGVLVLALAGSATAIADTDWPVAGGDPGSRKFSPLVQVNRDNVHTLQPAWEYHSARGVELFSSSELQLNPIVVDGVLYGRNPLHHAFAVEAATGRELWRMRGLESNAVTTPLAGDGVVVFSSGYPSKISVAVRPGGEGDITDSIAGG